eukprot:SAG25_NODE_3241_length_1161_cov_1.264595_1_plen_115_part_00
MRRTISPSHENLNHDIVMNACADAKAKESGKVGYQIPSFSGISTDVLKAAVAEEFAARERRLKTEQEASDVPPPPKHDANFKVFALEYHRLRASIDRKVASVQGKVAVAVNEVV